VEPSAFLWVGLGALAVLVLQRLLRGQTTLRGVSGTAAPPVSTFSAATPAPQPLVGAPTPQTVHIHMPAKAVGRALETPAAEAAPSYETWITIPTKITVQPQPPQAPEGPRLA